MRSGRDRSSRQTRRSAWLRSPERAVVSLFTVRHAPGRPGRSWANWWQRDRAGRASRRRDGSENRSGTESRRSGSVPPTATWCRSTTSRRPSSASSSCAVTAPATGPSQRASTPKGSSHAVPSGGRLWRCAPSSFEPAFRHETRPHVRRQRQTRDDAVLDVESSPGIARVFRSAAPVVRHHPRRGVAARSDVPRRLALGTVGRVASRAGGNRDPSAPASAGTDHLALEHGSTPMTNDHDPRKISQNF